eukprot:jgi/Tetstr1/435752/TSEL_024647.t1
MPGAAQAPMRLDDSEEDEEELFQPRRKVAKHHERHGALADRSNRPPRAVTGGNGTAPQAKPGGKIKRGVDAARRRVGTAGAIASGQQAGDNAAARSWAPSPPVRAGILRHGPDLAAAAAAATHEEACAQPFPQTEHADGADSCCPVCWCVLSAVAETALGREAHVNSCLDRSIGGDESSMTAAGGVEDQGMRGGQEELRAGKAAQPTPPASDDGACDRCDGGWGGDAAEEEWGWEDEERGLGADEEWPAHCPEAMDADAAEGCGPEQGGCSPGPDSLISAWLVSLRLQCYLGVFEREEVDIEAVQHLSVKDLEEIGINSHEHRALLVAAARELGESCRQADEGQPTTASTGDKPSAASSSTLSSVVGRAEAKAFFQRLRQAPSTIATATTSTGTAAGAEAARAPKQQPQRGGSQWDRRAGGGRSATGAAAGCSSIPPPRHDHRFVHGTNFVVDGFTRNFSTTECKHWFLTHFHSDHYQGLSSTFQRGTIYCTPITAALVAQELRVRPQRVFRVHPGQPITVDGVRVTFLDANHCPGAAMILFEPPDGAPPVLHTGDCRACPAMQDQAALQAVRGRVRLVLDATYCTPDYDCPPQEEAVKMVVDGVRSESFNPNTLFLIGTYKIGKERCFLEVGRQLERKVYVSETKMKVLRCLNLDPDHMKWLTTDDKQADIHVVPMQKVSMKAVQSAVKFYRGRYKTVVVFRPTGWAMQQRAKAHTRGRRQKRGTVVTYQVPYSEHSTLCELREFVSWLQPSAIKLHSFSGRSERDCLQLLHAGG